MRSQISKEEAGICQRLRFAREWSDLSQETLANRVGVSRNKIAHHEALRSPLRHDLALRICRQLVISEEWLATGNFPTIKEQWVKRGFDPVEDWSSLDKFFLRQCMDLFSHPRTRQIPPDTLFSTAFPDYLSGVYKELVSKFFFYPRIVFSTKPEPFLARTLFNAFFDRWFLSLSNEGHLHQKDGWLCQRMFLRAIIDVNEFIFSRFAGAPRKAPARLNWLQQALADPEVLIGPFAPETKEEPEELAIPSD